MIPRFVESTSLLPEDLDKNIWEWGMPRTEKVSVPAGFAYGPMASHVILAACSEDESAWEDQSSELARGAFTAGLVKKLYQENLSRITYSTLVDILPISKQQHPQCQGINKDRALFNGAVIAHQTTFRLYIDDGKYCAAAGDVHGVIKGTLFAIHAFENVVAMDSEIGVLEANSVVAHSCTLCLRHGDAKFDIPDSARALVLNWRQPDSRLKVFIDPPRDDVQSMEESFCLVDHPDCADLVVRHSDGGPLEFDRWDPVMSKYALELNDIWPESSLSNILQGISHFNFHLLRRNSANPLRQQVKVVLHRLEQTNRDDVSEEPLYMPDGRFHMPLLLDRENTVTIPTKAVTALDCNRIFYGLTVTNYSGRQLFPYLVYFDPSDYSIQVM
jgi:hypothetical protein